MGDIGASPLLNEDTCYSDYGTVPSTEHPLKSPLELEFELRNWSSAGASSTALHNLKNVYIGGVLVNNPVSQVTSPVDV